MIPMLVGFLPAVLANGRDIYVLLLRTLSALLIVVLLSGSVLTACGASASTARHLSPNEIAKQVGAQYGDPQAHVAMAKPDVTDGLQQPMYHMALTGRFHKGALEATRLNFSALADRMYVWAITAHDDAGNEVWFDRELGSAQPSS